MARSESVNEGSDLGFFDEEDPEGGSFSYEEPDGMRRLACCA
ncbi:hypothetical protein COLO4_13631 [Corchorus olitorius]|uniref:Uncharacterized protein n=1 Tax=Corchorus olitorius TaxID=93759 RepID=A0A1R3JVP3_9ROSI|nr:hypothetical protein COLO4_13631 [Corchorus olitorius]